MMQCTDFSVKNLEIARILEHSLANFREKSKNMLKKLFQQQRQYINSFFDKINVEDAEELLHRLHRCKGIIFFTGIGKSGLVAKKVAVTMTSTGSRALFLSPTNALHGDIGMISEEDAFVFFSKSGASEELLNLIPSLRNKGVSPIAIVCKQNSPLERACDFTVVLPLEKELGPIDLVPTTSATIQLAFGDILAAGLMELKHFDEEKYQMNHPAGLIGKRMLLKVKDLMLTGDKLPLCSPKDTLVDILVELSNKQCGCLLVIDPDMILLGIFTDGDLRRSLQNHGPKALSKKVEELMTISPRVTYPNILATKALEMMEFDQKRPITVLAVVEEKTQKVKGLIKMHDILQTGI